MIIYNGTIYTMTGEPIQNGFVETDGGKILRVGKMLELDRAPGPKDYNAFGLNVYPGFIDAHCHIGMWENGLGFEGDDGNEITDPATPQLRAIDAINPDDYCFKEAVKAGVTSVVVGMGSANPIGGEFLAMKTYGGSRIESRIEKMPVAIKFALGENPKRVYNDRDETPITRMATAAIIREQLYKTRRYMKDLESYESSKNTDSEATPPEFDFKCEALMPLLQKKIKAHFHCHRADDIFTAIRIAEEFDLDYVLIHATEGGLVAKELPEVPPPCVVGPVIADRGKPELRNQTIENAARLNLAGVKVAICTDHPENPIQYLPLGAGVAMKGGLSERAALEAITCNPADICDLEGVGRIQPGMDADITVYEGKFYEVLSRAKLTLVNGEIAYIDTDRK